MNPPQGVTLDESLLLLRRWPRSGEYGGLHSLFADHNAKQGIVVGKSDVTLHWYHPCEFVSTVYDEPLECVHARRRAFEGGSIKFNEPLPQDFPDRCLLSDVAHATEYRRGLIRFRWLLATTFEVPAFCMSVALYPKARVDWGNIVGEERLEVLRAAMQIKPKLFDVVGVHTQDFQLQGALEFVERLADDTYSGHLIAVSQQGRELRPGDMLHGKSIGMIGETRISAECCLAEVLEIGEPSVPPLHIPGEGAA